MAARPHNIVVIKTDAFAAGARAFDRMIAPAPWTTGRHAVYDLAGG